MGIILGKSERVSVIAAVFAFFMILVGYPAVRDGNMASFALSTFFLLAVALVFCASEETSPGDSRLVWPFFATWPLYGVAVAAQSPSAVFSVLDVISKGAFAMAFLLW